MAMLQVIPGYRAKPTRSPAIIRIGHPGLLDAETKS